MSQALWSAGGLRFWSQSEITYRNMAVEQINSTIQKSLKGINAAWQFVQCETPMLVPRSSVAESYDHDDIWMLQAEIMGDNAAMRPETTAGSYMVAKRLMQTEKWAKPPISVWQVGKSYRRETNDGASASKLRFNEFTQAEWQCIYREDTKADYRAVVENDLREQLQWLCKKSESRIVPSDRLPGYSLITNDVEVLRPNGRWTEVCSISTRNDFGEGFLVLEIAVGMDRIVEISNE